MSCPVILILLCLDYLSESFPQVKHANCSSKDDLLDNVDSGILYNVLHTQKYRENTIKSLITS